MCGLVAFEGWVCRVSVILCEPGVVDVWFWLIFESWGIGETWYCAYSCEGTGYLEEFRECFDAFLGAEDFQEGNCS